jgi:hypothetical protein
MGIMPYIQPDWSQPKLTLNDARIVCQRVKLNPVDITSDVIAKVLNSLRTSHANGGAFLSAVMIEEDPIFDHFASRNWLLKYQLLGRLLHRTEIRTSLRDLAITDAIDPPESPAESLVSLTDGFTKESPFLFDGKLAWTLYEGGAYHKPQGDGRTEKELANSFCEALFQNRYAEIEFFSSHHAWTPWFQDVNWDWTAVLLDLRKRMMWILVLTDTD